MLEHSNCERSVSEKDWRPAFRLRNELKKQYKAAMGEELLDPDIRRVLEQAFPDEEPRYFSPIIVGSTPTSADEGAAAILEGAKTATSSPFWHWPDGRIPIVGALSVLLDAQGRARAIVETQRVEIVRFGSVDESFAWSYGEGERTLAWWRSNIGAWYGGSAARHAASFSDDTPIICEWINVVKRLWSVVG